MTNKYFVLCLLAVAACGGSEKSPEAAPASTPPASAAPATPAAEAPPPAASPALLTPDATALAAKSPGTYNVVFVTSEGEIEVAVERALAPKAADRMHYLATNGFFNGARFFRVIRGFVVQFGLSGNPAVDAVFDTLNLKDEPRKISNSKGTLVFATRGPDTRNTQMFINLADNGPLLDSQGFAPFGRVVRGMDVAEKLFATYAEMPSQQQHLIISRGNTWLHQRYPELDSIVSTSIKP